MASGTASSTFKISKNPKKGSRSSARSFSQTLSIVKVIDVAFSQNGVRTYKVQWEETWEKEEELLAKYENLLQQFWEQKISVNPNALLEDVNPEKISKMTKLKEQSAYKSQLPVACIEIPAAKDSVKVTTDLPDQYKRVRFAKSVREQFSKEVSTVDSSHDYVKEIMEKKKKYFIKKKQGSEKRSRQEIIRDYVSYKKNTRVRCDLCWETFSDDKSLSRHKVCRHHKFSPHQCPICHKMFIKPGDVRRHLPAHSSLRAFDCFCCSKSYKTKNHLHRHVKSKHSTYDGSYTDSIIEQLLENHHDEFEEEHGLVTGNGLEASEQQPSLYAGFLTDSNISETNQQNVLNVADQSFSLQSIDRNINIGIQTNGDLAMADASRLVTPAETPCGSVIDVVDVDNDSTCNGMEMESNSSVTVNPTYILKTSNPSATPVSLNEEISQLSSLLPSDAINSNLLLQVNATVLDNSNIMLQHDSELDNFLPTRSDTLQMCILDRTFFNQGFQNAFK